VQVDPIKHKLKAPGTNILTLKCDVLLSTFAFEFSLRRYIKAWPNAPGGACSAAVSAVIAPEYSPRKVPAAVAAVTMVGRCRLTL